MVSRRLWKLVNLLLVPVALTLGAMDLLFAQSEEEQTDIEMSRISGDVDNPRRHFRLRNPRKLDKAEANRIYNLIQSALSLGYSNSSQSFLEDYQSWQRYNSAPYLSATHGNHYLNNYANNVAKSYGEFESAGTLPKGAVLVKDSFSMTQSREIVLGPLFVMQKMPDGFNDVTGNWKYLQIQPDGTLLGETNGHGAQRVEFCVPCHLARETFDHLYFIPQDYRVPAQ